MPPEGPGPDSGPDGLERAGEAERSGRASVRRIEAFAVGWTALGTGLFLAAGRPRGALVLTLGGGVSIVAFRGLQRVIYALGPAPEGSKPGSWRRGLLAFARWLLLGGAVVTAFLLAPNELLGLIAGFSTLPAALMSEGVLLLVRTLLEERR